MAIERGEFKGTIPEAAELLFVVSRKVSCKSATDREIIESAYQQLAAHLAGEDTQESDPETGD